MDQLHRHPRSPAGLPLLARPMRDAATRFAALPCLAVLGHYAIGICTFSIMAAADLPDGDGLALLAWDALRNTGAAALAAALAAGRWWV